MPPARAAPCCGMQCLPLTIAVQMRWRPDCTSGEAVLSKQLKGKTGCNSGALPGSSGLAVAAAQLHCSHLCISMHPQPISSPVPHAPAGDMEELPEGTENKYNPNINRIRPSPHEPDSEPPSRRTTGDGAGRAGAAPTGVPHCQSCSFVGALLAASTGARSI